MRLLVWLSCFVLAASQQCPTAGCGFCQICDAGACKPNPNTAGGKCAECRVCTNGECGPDLTQDGRQCSNGFCRNGACVSACGAGCGSCKKCSGTACVVDVTAGGCPNCQKCSDAGTCVADPNGQCEGTCVEGQCRPPNVCSPNCNSCQVCANGACTTNANPPATACPECNICVSGSGVPAACGPDSQQNGKPCSSGLCRDGKCVSVCTTSSGATGCDICKRCSAGQCVADDSQTCGDCKKCSQGQCVTDDVSTGPCSKGHCAQGQCVNNCPTTGCGPCRTCFNGECVVAATVGGCAECQKCDDNGRCVADGAATTCGDAGAGTCTSGTCSSSTCTFIPAGATSPTPGCPTCQICTRGACVADSTGKGCPVCYACENGRCTPTTGTCPNGKCDGQGNCVNSCPATGCGVCQACVSGACAPLASTAPNPCGPCRKCGVDNAGAPTCVVAADGDPCEGGTCKTGQCVSGCPATGCPRCLACIGGKCQIDPSAGTTNVCPECQSCKDVTGCTPNANTDPLTTCSQGSCRDGKCQSNCPATGCGRCKACVRGNCMPSPPTTGSVNPCPPCQVCGDKGECVADATQDKKECPGGLCAAGVCQSQCPTAGCPACQSCKDGKCVYDSAVTTGCPECFKCSATGCVADTTQSTCSTGVCGSGSVCTNQCPAAGCPPCQICGREGTCVADTAQEGKDCKEGICKSGRCTSRCPLDGCGPCSICGPTGQCNIDTSSTAGGCRVCQKCQDGQCAPDDTQKCDGGFCKGGSCVSACSNAAGRCDICQKCNPTDGTCGADDTQTCFGGACKGGSCKCGDGPACTIPNICQDGKCVLGCPELIRKLATACKCNGIPTDLKNTASCPDFCTAYNDADSGCKDAAVALADCAKSHGLGVYAEQIGRLDSLCTTVDAGAAQLGVPIAALAGFTLFY